MGVSLIVLSGSTDGKPIKLTGTTSGGANTLHTATAATGGIDKVKLYAMNSDTTADRIVTVMIGGSTSPDLLELVTIPKGSQGNGQDGGRYIGTYTLQNGQVLSAYCGTANVVMIRGEVMRKL